jgi:cytochrome c oxidase subunit 1
MASVTADSLAHGHVEHAHAGSFLTTYVFSRDHKIIGIQFLFSTLVWFLVGGLLALVSAGNWRTPGPMYLC